MIPFFILIAEALSAEASFPFWAFKSRLFGVVRSAISTFDGVIDRTLGGALMISTRGLERAAVWLSLHLLVDLAGQTALAARLEDWSFLRLSMMSRRRCTRVTFLLISLRLSSTFMSASYFDICPLCSDPRARLT